MDDVCSKYAPRYIDQNIGLVDGQQALHPCSKVNRMTASKNGQGPADESDEIDPLTDQLWAKALLSVALILSVIVAYGF
jgi:hypothetical protein